MKVSAALLLFALSAFANDPDYEALKILTKNCAGCHQMTDHPGALFLNAARLTEPETLGLIRRLLDAELMPKAHGKFKKSKEGKSLLEWLKNKEANLKKK
jgi:hypothetical protein